ncbi:MAG: DUF4270 domain-containing protein [Muribaculaceae bacterium]|nr:DUF4270 domain-containing protein [Muribaculaceae bacterium]
MKHTFIPICVAAVLSFAACDDSTSTIGSGLAGSSAEIIIDSAYTVTGKTVMVDAIFPKTTQQLIGKINIRNYGSLGSDAVCQFLPATELDTENFTTINVDSVFLTMTYTADAFKGDSLAPMGVTVYELTRPLLPDINSAFDPEGYYNPQALGSTIYNATVSNAPSASALNYRDISVKLPLELGRRIFRAYENNPEYFANGQIFSEKVFPGAYIKTSFGSGRISLVSTTMLAFHMRKIYLPEGETELDTIDAVHQYMLVAPEVINNNDINYSMSDYLKNKISAGENLLVAPAGCEMEFTMPAQQLADTYNTKSNGRGVLNSLTLSITVDTIENNGGVTPPPYVLMVPKSSRDEFFAKNKLPDNITSFYAAYDATTLSYTFPNMRAYLMEILKKDEITEDDITFSLVPVQVNFEELTNTGYSTTTSYTESEVLPYYAGPAMAIVRLNDSKIKLTFSIQ